MNFPSSDNWPDSPFYRQLYFTKDELNAEQFISQLVDRLRPGPNSRILHLACGNGEHSRLLAAAGYDVTGVDPSALNIEEAKRSETDNLHFFLHDMRLPFWGNYFDLAFIFFHGFGQFRTRREHDAAIRTIANSLKPGGLLVLDYPNLHYTEDNQVTNETKAIGATQYEIRCWNDALNFYKKIRITDPTLTSPVEYTERLAKYSMGDFTDMFSFQGLQVQEVFGDYQFQSYDLRKTPRLIMIARKGASMPEDKEKRLYSDGRRTDALT
jgi:SAM-dependent methyltransferase